VFIITKIIPLKRVAIYIRVSTQEQALEGYSVGAQTERLTAYCKAKDWQIFHIYTDPGFSGSNMQRPALQHMFDDIKNKRIDCVLVYKLDRLSRSQKDTLYMIEDMFLKNDVAFVSMNENFDTSTAFGRAMIGILSVFAQLEREQIKERTSMGRAERAKSGLWHGGGFRPFGYDYENGKLSVNSMEKIIVLDIYQAFLDHTPITAIVDLLSHKYGRNLNHSIIHSILTTPLYTGVISWQGKIYDGQHEAIIDNFTYQRAQHLMNDRARIAATKPFPFRSTTLLGGLLYCGNCGARYAAKGNYSGHGDRKIYRPYYYCYSRSKTSKKHILDPDCKNPVYPVVELDKAIVNEIQHLATSKRYFSQTVKKNQRSNYDNISSRRLSIMQRIDELELQKKRLIDLYQLGSIDIDAVDERSHKLTEETTALQMNLEAIEGHRSEKLPVNRARSLLQEFTVIVHTGTIDEQKNILHELIEKIIANEVQGDIDILWNF
jgi:site-specific DNA recombinase